MDENVFCPCQSGQEYPLCCGRFHSFKARPLTALELMRSRYSAYVLKKIDYIVETTHPDSRSQNLKSEIEAWAESVSWNGLEIVRTSMGEPKDKIGKVEFKARYVHEGNNRTHHELSRFKRYQKRWYYLDGEMVSE